MNRANALVLVGLLSGLISSTASANCMGQIEGPLPNQIGTIMLFSSRGGGAKPDIIPSEFWAVTGRYDTHPAHIYPVRFADNVREIVESWNWKDLALNPPVIIVLVDGKFEGEFMWLTVKMLLEWPEETEEAHEKFADASKGRCPSLFRTNYEQ